VSPASVERLRPLASDIVGLATPEPFMGVGLWYRAFVQVTDEEVVALLQESWGRQREPAGVS